MNASSILRTPDKNLATGIVYSLALSLEQGGIPDSQDLKNLIFLYSDISSGSNLSPSQVNCLYFVADARQFPRHSDFEKLGENISVGIESAFRRFGNRPSISSTLLEDHYNFTSEFFSGAGRKYFFRNDTRRQNARREIASLFNLSEQESLVKMGEILLPYKERIRASVQL